MFGIYFIDYFFLAQTRQAFPESAFLASFLGIFMGSVSIIELLIKSFLSGNILKKYGLKTALVLLPLLLALSTLIVVISGTLIGTAGIFFSFIALGKLLERILRSGFYEPGFQILYQPLPPEERINFQNNIEGVPKALGNIAAGTFLLIFTLIPAFNMLTGNLVFFFILLLWVRMVINISKEYRTTIREVVNKKNEKNPETNIAISCIKRLLFYIRLYGYVDLKNIDLKKYG